MRKVKKYQKYQGSKSQQEKLKKINRFQDDIAKFFYDRENKNKN